MEKKTFTLLFYISLLLNGFLIVSYLIYPIIGDDSGFYLAIARELFDGKIYFHEIGVSYNPLSIITFGLPFIFNENPNYSWHLLINIVVVIGSTIIFYKILNFISSIKIYNLFFSSLFLLLSLVLDGKYIMLEPLSVFFQLIVLYFYLEYLKEFSFKKMFFVGMFICLAFLSKQYGLFIALPICLDLLMRNKSVIKNILVLILGFLIPLGMFFTYLHSYGFGFIEFIKHILGKGVMLDMGNGTGIGTNFFTYSLDTVYILLFNLYALIIPVLIVRNFNKYDDKKMLFISLSIASLSVLFFANYWHYYQYIIPFWVILFVYLFQKLSIIKYRVIVVIIFGFSLSLTGIYSIKSFEGKKEFIANQEKTALILSSEIAPESEVYLDGLSPSYYYRCHLKSINLKNIGFSFPGYFYPKTIISYLNPGAYVLVTKDKFNFYKDYLSDCTVKELKVRSQEYLIIEKKKR